MTSPLLSSKNANDFAVLTPYPIPESLQGRKVANLGDGFILRAIERLLGRFSAGRAYSPRVAPTDTQISLFEARPAVILAGANQLNDRYTVWPGLSAERIRNGKLCFIPFGIGLHGEPGYNDSMSGETKTILEAIHERIAYSSWRCPHTVTVLQRELPHLASQFLMTGCPVLYDAPLLESSRFHEGEAAVAVTPTERHDFWERETTIIDAVASRFPTARRYLVVHQNFSPPRPFEAVYHRFTRINAETEADRVAALRRYARRRGFEVVIPRNADECIRFYDRVDLHVGTRLHAHLLFLSRNKRSYLVPIDGRSLGIAESLDFPLLDPAELDDNWNFNFEMVRNRAVENFKTMQIFLASLSI